LGESLGNLSSLSVQEKLSKKGMSEAGTGAGEPSTRTLSRKAKGSGVHPPEKGSPLEKGEGEAGKKENRAHGLESGKRKSAHETEIPHPE